MTAAPRIGALVLAAGASTRLGSPKQLIVHEGVPLVRRAAIATADAGANPVVVVLGANASLIEPALRGLASVTTVVNADWANGMSSSLATGLRALGDAIEYDAVLITLADQPFVDAGALKRLIAAFDNEHRIVSSAYNGVIGVPAVFAREYVADLMQLEGDSGAGQWLRRRSGEVTSIPLDAGAVDIDTPADETRLLS
jgi:CTP:molybdopterin cytidylyltransferase MocA